MSLYSIQWKGQPFLQSSSKFSQNSIYNRSILEHLAEVPVASEKWITRWTNIKILGMISLELLVIVDG
jgi:hypothetical protein